MVALENGARQRDQLLHGPGDPLATGGQQTLEIVLRARQGLIGQHGTVGQQLGKLLAQIEARECGRVKLHPVEVRQPIDLRS